MAMQRHSYVRTGARAAAQFHSYVDRIRSSAEEPALPTLTDPTFSLAGSTWPNSDARFLFPPVNLYAEGSFPGLARVGNICDAATAVTVIARFAIPTDVSNLVDSMSVWSRRLDAFDFQIQLVLMADRSLRAGVSADGGAWLQIDTPAATVAAGATVVVALVYDGSQPTAATQLRLFMADGMGEINEQSPTYSGAASVTSLFTPLFCGWNIGGVYTGDTTTSRGLRDVTVFDVAFWTGLAAEGYALVRACYAEAPEDFLGPVTERFTCIGATATSEVYVGPGGNSGLAQSGVTGASGDWIFEGFRRYPASFVSALDNPGRRVLQDPQGVDAPFAVVPATGGYAQSGITLYDQAVSIENRTPNAFVLIGGLFANQPAGLFGDIAGNVFSGAAGFVFHASASIDVNTLGTRGGYALARAFGANFQVSELLGNGYGNDSGDAVAGGYHRLVGASFPALGAAAARDGRRLAVLMVLEAGASNVYMALIDRSDRFNPLLIEQGMFAYQFAAFTDAWPEINASGGTGLGTDPPVVVREHTIDVFEGRLALPVEV